MNQPPIERYALLSGRQTVALVVDGSMDRRTANALRAAATRAWPGPR